MPEVMSWSLKMWSTRRLAVSRAVGSFGRTSKFAAFEKQSTTVRMTMFPLDVGKPITKSRAMWNSFQIGHSTMALIFSWSAFNLPQS